MLTEFQHDALQSALEQIQQGATLAISILNELRETPAPSDPSPAPLTIISPQPQSPSVSIVAFARAIALVQSRNYMHSTEPLLRMSKDHVFLERLASELGLISSLRSHTEYIRVLREAEQQDNLCIAHFPKNKVNLSYYIYSIREGSTFPDWTEGSIAHFDFLRCMELTRQVLTEYHRLSVELSV